MCKPLFYLLNEIGVTLLNVGLITGSTIRLYQRSKKELNDQLKEIDKKEINHGKEIGTAWQNANSNLNFNKTLQWNYIYYVVLLFGAVVALTLTYESNLVVQLILCFAVNLVFHVGLYLTIDIQLQIRRERLSIISIQLLLTEKPKQIVELNSRKNHAVKFLYHPYITLTLILTVFAGYALALFLIIRNTIK